MEGGDQPHGSMAELTLGQLVDGGGELMQSSVDQDQVDDETLEIAISMMQNQMQQQHPQQQHNGLHHHQQSDITTEITQISGDHHFYG